MLVLAWLLSACVVGGSLSYDSKEYGQIYRMRLHIMAKSLEFISSRSGESVVLWKHGDPYREDIRRKVVGNFFVLYNVTQEDSGQYTMRDRNGLRLSGWHLDVEEKSESYTLYPGQTFRVTFKLDPDSCNILFIPEGTDEYRGTYIVRHGQLHYDRYNLDCSEFDQSQPCGIVSTNIHEPCNGRYLVQDNNGNTALAVHLEVESSSSSSDTSKIGISAGIVSFVVSCCCCLKRCCCGKSSSKKDQPETPDGEPAVEHHECDREPAGPPSYQLSPEAVTLYLTSTSSTGPTGPSDPLIHPPPPPPPPTVNPPPAYSEVTAISATGDAPTVSVPMDLGSEPRFELKGLTFSSNSSSDVYTSDKLNFL